MQIIFSFQIRNSMVNKNIPTAGNVITPEKSGTAIMFFSKAEKCIDNREFNF